MKKVILLLLVGMVIHLTGCTSSEEYQRRNVMNSGLCDTNGQCGPYDPNVSQEVSAQVNQAL